MRPFAQAVQAIAVQYLWSEIKSEEGIDQIEQLLSANSRLDTATLLFWIMVQFEDMKTELDKTSKV
jgi:hypothetical protein